MIMEIFIYSKKKSVILSYTNHTNDSVRWSSNEINYNEKDYMIEKQINSFGYYFHSFPRKSCCFVI